VRYALSLIDLRSGDPPSPGRKAQSRNDQSVVSPRPPAQRLPALVYLAELRVRTGDRDAAAALLAQIVALELSPTDREALAADLAIAAEMAADLRT
jgi:ATP/maltotriose-dependent transcriptional regulator MalT